LKKALFRSYILIVILALVLSGSIFGVANSNIILIQSKENMLYSVRIADYGFDYNGDMQSQVEQLKDVDGNENARFTVIAADGTVLADSEVADRTLMRNHMDREEIKEALSKGIGYAIRRSDTLNKSMLYIATLSKNKNYILRMAVPLSGIEQYIGLIIPGFLISMGITFAISIFLANRFSTSLMNPLRDIAEELHKLKEKNPEFHFRRYKYDEINLISDTTKKMAEEVREYMNQIEFEKMVRQEFFSNVSHELKTPLTSIRGFLELIENDMVTDEKTKRDFLVRIKKETENMTGLINDILMISRLETKEAKVTLSEVRLAPLVKEVCSSLEPLAKEYQVSLIMNCRPVSIYANTQQLRELFNNLIINAIKYNKPQGSVYVTITSEADDIIIIIEDTGVGIPEDAKQRIFERFYRVDKGRSKRVGGTGLGLSIVKHIVNFYHGSIEVESKLMEGTRFTVHLPKRGLYEEANTIE
jgi:two-component system phosphate regulon sensor histidine kinase PhoR